MSAQATDDDIIEVKLSKGSIAALAKVMGGGGGGLAGGKGGGGLAGLMKIGGKGMMVLGGIGIAIGAILGAVKALTGSSPMLKQMFKLMNFGIMMIFRPIGDFIGFMLRPILVLLLRNFIIPWYKDMMPIMQSIGSIFGSSLAKDLDAFFKDPAQVIADALNGLGDWAATQLNSMLDGTFDWADLGTRIWEAVKVIITNLPTVTLIKFIAEIIQKMDLSKLSGAFTEVGTKIKTAITTWFQGGIDAITGGLGFIQTSISTWFQSGIDKITGGIDFVRSFIINWFSKEMGKIVGGATFVYTSISTWFSKEIDKITGGLDFVRSFIINWFSKEMGKIVGGATFVYTEIFNWFWNGLNSIQASWQDLWSWISEWIKKGINNVSSSIGLGNIIGNADGGMITEPILGFGKSGQMYSFGEKGSEEVIPHGQSAGGGGGGITLNISVGNISSEGDMRNFESRVMEVLENANSRRGRV